MSRSTRQPLLGQKRLGELNATPEADKYLRETRMRRFFRKQVLQRLAWLGLLPLSLLSAVPLTFKFIANLLDSIGDKTSLIEARNNLGTLIGIPILGSIGSVLAFLFPDRIGSWFATKSITPMGLLFKLEENKTDQSLTLESKLTHGKQRLTLPQNSQRRDVESCDQTTIDSLDIPLADNNTSRHRITFNAALQIYHTEARSYTTENEALHCQTRAFNYPGITDNNHIDHMNDIINAGIAQVYDLAKLHQWTNAEAEKNLHLYGYCYGGAVALQVAAYFKLRHQMNLKIFVDRSFRTLTDAIAGLMARHTGLPFWYARVMAGCYLYAGNELFLDSITAAKTLNKDYLYYINVGDANPDKRTTFYSTVKKFFGIGAEPSPDCIITDPASFTNAFAAESMQCDSTQAINGQLANNSHLVYQPSNNGCNGHFAAMTDLYMGRGSVMSARMFYFASMREGDSQTEEKSQHVARVERFSA
jgi:hypothetical protein